MQDQPVTRLAALLWWARTHWKTTVAGVLAATAVVLQRIPESRPHWQDVAAALLLILLGMLAKDPDKLLDARRR